MSLETEIKKVANNLQQLTDAVVTLTAEMQALKGSTVLLPHKQGCGDIAKPANSHVAENLETKSDSKIETQIRGMSADVIITDEIDNTAGYKPSTNNPKVEEPIANTVVDMHAGIHDINEPISIAIANAALNEINQQIGDGGIAIRTLLQQHNAITLGQIAPEKYIAFVDEARGLIPVKQA